MDASNPPFHYMVTLPLSSQLLVLPLNERIAEDMDTQSEELLGPLVFSTCQVLMRYKGISKSDTIMTGTDEFEVTLRRDLDNTLIHSLKIVLYSRMQKS